MRQRKNQLVLPSHPDSYPINRLLKHLPRYRRAVQGCISVLVLVLLPVVCGAAPAARFFRLSVEQGLSQNTVVAILQDRVGFLWFATEEGLNRYDGYKFVVFKHNPADPQSLPDNNVTALFEDRQGTFWVGTEHGLCIYDRSTDSFSQIPSIVDKVTSIIEDPDGTLWVGVEGGGLFLRRPAKVEFASYQPTPNDPESLVSFRVSTLLRDRAGRLWVGTKDAGVDRFEPTGEYGRFHHYRYDPKNRYSLAHDNVWGLAEDHAGNIWVATYGGGLNILDPKSGRFRRYRHRSGDLKSIPTDLITCVFVDGSGTVWVGTDGHGILTYDPASDSFTAFENNGSDPASLSGNVIRAIYQDIQEQLWFGTYNRGVNLLKNTRRAFGYFNNDPSDDSSLSDRAVASFLEDVDGGIWIGTEQGWLNYYNRLNGSFTRYDLKPPLAGRAVLALHQDRRGRIWVGSFQGGLALFDPKRRSSRVFRHRPGDSTSLDDNEVWVISEDEDGILWLGTNAGVNRFDPDRGIVTLRFQAPTVGQRSHAGIRCLHRDSHGNLWVGTIGGLVLRRHDNNEIVNYQHNPDDPRSLTKGAVFALHEDRNGRLWIGTEGGGISYLEPGSETFVSYKDFPSTVIHGIQEDASGRLWLSTNHGLSRFNPETREVESFDLANGLQSLQFHLGASLKTGDGRLLFGSWDGFYEFDPQAIKPNSFAPAVVLTSLRIFNKSVDLASVFSADDEITFSPTDKIFSIEFAALDYTFPRRNLYQYMMEGLGDKWIELNDTHEVTFTNLDPGRYVFRVKASNSDQIWNEPSTRAVRVVISPPLWATWWFRAIMAGAFALALVGAHRLRIRRLSADLAERKRAELALRQAEEKYRRLFEEDLSANVISTPDGTVVACNPSFAALFDFSSVDEATNYNLRSLHPDPDQWEALVDLIREEKKLEYYETELRRRDGTVLNVIANVVGVFDDDCNLVEIRGYLLDNTEHKKLEQQLLQAQKMEAIGRLAGGVAHDFNNWLTPIIGYSQLLLQGTDPRDPTRKKLEEISKAGERASTLAGQLLAFSRKQVLQLRILNLNRIIGDMQEMLRRLIGENVDLVTHLAPDLGRVKADPGQIEQVVLNLALNARDAMPKGGKLILETANVELDQSYAKQHLSVEPGPFVMLAVSDTGIGMDAGTQARIFEPFFTTKERGKGTGLGLATAYGIIKQSGGSISVYSEIESGTTFKIWLPRVYESTDAARPATITGSPHGTETVILVEDEPMVRDFVAVALRNQGYTVVEAEDASRALRLAEEYPDVIHLLLTDVVLPKMSGPELATRFTVLRRESKVLYISGYTGDAIVHHGILESGLPFLHKPFTPDALARKIREVLDSQNQIH